MKTLHGLFYFLILTLTLPMVPTVSFAADSSVTLQKLEDLDSAANALMAVVDERLPGAKLCHLDVATAASAMNPLHAQLDEQTSAYIQERQTTKADISQGSWVKDCDKECHCGLYASILETVGFEKLNLHDKKSYRTLSHLAVNSTKPAQTACAERAAAAGLNKCKLIDQLKASADDNQ